MGSSPQSLIERAGPWAFFALGLVLALPSLGLGLWSDDWGQGLFLRKVVSGGVTGRSWWDIYVLVPGDPAQRFSGVLPWWSAQELRVAFFRPVAAATHVLDYALWPESAWMMHLHSGLWFAASCAACFAALRRMTSRRVATIAALLYAVSHVHASPMGWIAQRNAVVAAALGLFALALALRYLERKQIRSLLASMLLLALGLLASEGVVVVCAAILLTGLLGSGERRPVLLLAGSCVALIVVWRSAYFALGYGVRGSGTYLDPMMSPVVFLAELPTRAVSLLGMHVVPSNGWLAMLVGAGVLSGCLPCLFQRKRPEVRFGAAVLLCSVVLLSAAEPSPRLLGVSSVFFWLLAATGLIAARGRGWLVSVAVGSCLVGQQWSLQNQPMRDPATDRELGELSEILGALEGKTLVLVDPPRYDAVHRLHRALIERGLPWPQWTLVLVTGEASIARHGCCTVGVQLGGPAFQDAGARLFSSDPSSVTSFKGLWFSVSAQEKQAYTFAFASALDAPHLEFATWRDGHWERWDPAED